MLPQITGMRKRCLTLRAFVGFLPGMCSRMVSHLIGELEGGIAVLTFVHLFTNMNRLMVVEFFEISENRFAPITGVQFVSSV